MAPDPASEGVPLTPALRASTRSSSGRNTRKLMLVVMSILGDFLLTGIIYGYSGVLPELTLNAKAFASLCKEDEELPCKGQLRALTAAFTFGLSTISASGIVIGIIMDSIGPRYTTIIGCLIFSMGLGAFAAAPAFDDHLYYAGFFLLALGGPAFLTATMNFADLYPGVSSGIVCAQNGAFDASSAVMFTMGKIVSGFGVSFSTVMLGYLAVPAAVIVIAFFLFPDVPFGTGVRIEGAEEEEDGRPEVPEDEQGELWRNYRIRLARLRAEGANFPGRIDPTVISTESLRDTINNSFRASLGGPATLREPLLEQYAPDQLTIEEEQEEGVLPAPATNGVAESAGGVAESAGELTRPLLTRRPSQSLPKPPDIYNTDVRKQLSSLVFWVHLVVSAYLTIRTNFFFASVNRQISFAVMHHKIPPPDPEAAIHFYVDLFNYIVPIAGICSVPFSGMTMVNLGLTTTFMLIGGMCMGVSVLQIFDTILPLEAQIVAFILFAVLRAFVFGAIAAFLGQIFGFRNFGRLFGVNRFASALVVLIQFPIIGMVENQFGGDYTPVMIGFFCLEVILTVAFPIYLWKRVFYGHFFIPPHVETLQ